MQGQQKHAGVDGWHGKHGFELIAGGAANDRQVQHLERRDRPAGRLSPRLLSGCMRLFDVLIVLGCGLLSQAILAAQGQPVGGAQFNMVILSALLLQANLFHFAGLYRANNFTNLPSNLSRLLGAWVLVFLALASFGLIIGDVAAFWNDGMLLWFGFGLLGLSSLRVGQKHLAQRWNAEGRLARTVAIVGAGEHGHRLLRSLNDRHGEQIEIVGIFDDRKGRVPDVLEGHRLCGTVSDLLRYAQSYPVDQIIVALPWSAEDRILEILQQLRVLPADITISPDMIGFRLAESGIGQIGTLPSVDVFRKPLSDWNLVAKEAFDRITGTAIALAILPVLLIIALLVKLDSPGPVLFRQKRYGFNNQAFEVFKFRTMYLEASLDKSAPQAKQNDPRVTRIGRILRKTSLDELPQIFNVLNGSMSLVGPRPHSVPRTEYFEGLVDEYASRHRVKPGITGWAQVNGLRGETDTIEKIRRRVEHDIYYIDHWSVAFDLWIMILTAFVVLRGENAH